MNEKRKKYLLFFSFKPIKEITEWIMWSVMQDKIVGHNKKSLLGID